ncbi:MAG: LacI family DNA-binding transcriptional regulator [Anaerolineae bacterium]
MSVTRDDVARRAGVSPATVSYVINDGPRPVSAETRAKVLEAIRELGYRPSAVARSLRRQKTTTLGLIVPDTNNPYFAEVARGIEHIAFESGYTVILCHSGYDPERELQYVDVLREERAAGVIWIPATANFEPAHELAEYGVPVVVLDRLAPGEQVPSVVADNFRGGYAATEHLINLGHRRIGCIARPVDLSHSQDRIYGYQAALRDHSRPADDALIAKGGFRLENGRKATFYLLDLDPPPTALFAYNDIMAIGALRAAHERGLRVPQDFSIVGFDDIAQAAFTCPALTTVAQQKFDMGRRGAELLLGLIAGKTLPVGAQTPLEVRLIVRESTGPAPQT